MADLTPVAGEADVMLTGQLVPANARIDGNMVGQAYDAAGNETTLPAGYEFVEEGPLTTRVVCPLDPDDVNAPDVIVGQKADKDLSEGVVFLTGEKFSIKTIPASATEIHTGAGIVPKVGGVARTARR